MSLLFSFALSAEVDNEKKITAPQVNVEELLDRIQTLEKELAAVNNELEKLKRTKPKKRKTQGIKTTNDKQVTEIK